MSESAGFILNNLDTAVILLDHTLGLVSMNQAAQSLLDVSEKRYLTHPLTRILRQSADLEPVLYDSLRANQRYTQRKATLTLLNGEDLICDYTVTPVNEAESPRLLLEIYPMSRYLRIDREELLRTHQETTRQMIRGLAHEIKNPLGGIRGTAQLLSRELPSENLREFTEIIIEETDRLAQLVDRLLGPNTLLRPGYINIHEILERVYMLISAESHNRIEVCRDYDPSIPELLIDRELVMQALLNLARNSMQSLEETPRPTITIRTRAERQFTIGTTTHRLALRIDISDNGPGIPPELKDQLFFPMISGRAEGTGLGLPLAQSIITAHQGLIKFESEPGLTTFTTILPIEPKTETNQ